MRKKGTVVEIDYNETRDFWVHRGEKFKENNPYVSVMFQDQHEDIVKEKNDAEQKKLYPMLSLNKYSRVLDMACGVGRWADAISCDIDKYLGMDFCVEVLNIAKQRNKKTNFDFIAAAAQNVEKELKCRDKGKYNVILIVGLFVYLNDEDVCRILEQINNIAEEHAKILIREPIALEQRLTLKGYYSEELEENYSAIYRTREEILSMYHQYLEKNKFMICKEGFLFEDAKFNNREETAQYYWLLQR